MTSSLGMILRCSGQLQNHLNRSSLGPRTFHLSSQLGVLLQGLNCFRSVRNSWTQRENQSLTRSRSHTRSMARNRLHHRLARGGEQAPSVQRRAFSKFTIRPFSYRAPQTALPRPEKLRCSTRPSMFAPIRVEILSLHAGSSDCARPFATDFMDLRD
jgi:hypothetical protein